MSMLEQVQDANAEELREENGESQAPERDYEAEAREMGWVPKDEFKGDTSRWSDAETFVKKGEEVLPLIKAQNKALKRQLDEMKRDLKKASAYFSDAEKRGYERARAEIEERLEQAVESGDAAAAKKAMADADKLREDMRDTKSENSAEDAKEAFDDWREGNTWYDRANLSSASETDINARLYADRMVEKHLDKTKDMSPSEFFDFIGGLVHERFPSLKAKPPRQKPQSEVAGGTRAAPRGGRSFADLPQEAQRMADKWIKQGLIKDRATYLQSYKWD